MKILEKKDFRGDTYYSVLFGNDTWLADIDFCLSRKRWVMVTWDDRNFTTEQLNEILIFMKSLEEK